MHGWFLPARMNIRSDGGYDHFHMLLTPGDKWNISEVMHNLKRVTSLQINQILEGEDIYPRLQGTDQLYSCRS